MNRLKQNGWHDEYEMLVYFTINNDYGKQLWCSSWYDVREFAEFPGTIDIFRDEVREACLKFDAEHGNLDSEDYWEWEME